MAYIYIYIFKLKSPSKLACRVAAAGDGKAWVAQNAIDDVSSSVPWAHSGTSCREGPGIGLDETNTHAN